MASMQLSAMLLQEFDHEMANTRKTLERVPDGKMDWKPHEKSMVLGRLAGHLAEMPTWAFMSLRKDALDLAPAGGTPMQPFVAKSRQEVLEAFDKNTKDARAAIADSTDEHFMQPWSLQKAGKTMMTMPRIAVVRNWVLNHMIHHRAQLGVYLRLNDIPVPAIYGQSADEGSMFG